MSVGKQLQVTQLLHSQDTNWKGAEELDEKYWQSMNGLGDSNHWKLKLYLNVCSILLVLQG